MSDGNKTDDLKGRAKEATGAITDNEDLKQEGKVDQAVSGVKDAVDGVADKVKDLIGDDDK